MTETYFAHWVKNYMRYEFDLPSNFLQTVQTYQESELAYLLNLCCFVIEENESE